MTNPNPNTAAANTEPDWEVVEVYVEYWAYGRYEREPITIYTDEVNPNDPTEVIDHAVNALDLEHTPATLRATVAGKVITLWHTPLEDIPFGGSSAQYEIKAA